MDRLEIRRIGCKQLTDEEQEAKSKYLPTPAEIAAECLVIQSEWTRQVECSRRGALWREDGGVRIPECRSEFDET